AAQDTTSKTADLVGGRIAPRRHGVGGAGRPLERPDVEPAPLAIERELALREHERVVAAEERPEPVERGIERGLRRIAFRVGPQQPGEAGGVHALDAKRDERLEELERL